MGIIMEVIESLSNLLGNISSMVTLDKILASVLVLVAGFLLAYTFKRLVYRVAIKVTPPDIARSLSNLAYYVVVTIAVVTILAILGVNVASFIVAGGVIGIILGFASQTIVSNLLAGVFLYWDKPFKPGDPVNIEGVAGIVKEISILSTRIQTWDGVYVRIPNEKVFTTTIVNYGRMPIRRVELKASIAYKEDFEKALEVIRRLVDQHPLILAKPEPVIYVSQLGSDGVEITIQVWTPTSEWINVKRELLWLIKKELTKVGIEIPFPQRDVWFRTPLEIRIIEKREVGEHETTSKQ